MRKRESNCLGKFSVTKALLEAYRHFNFTIKVGV